MHNLWADVRFLCERGPRFPEHTLGSAAPGAPRLWEPHMKVLRPWFSSGRGFMAGSGVTLESHWCPWVQPPVRPLPASWRPAVPVHSVALPPGEDVLLIRKQGALSPSTVREPACIPGSAQSRGMLAQRHAPLTPEPLDHICMGRERFPI